ncbi:DUF1254 domain-containing protein [Lutimonas zeaxanthinifaciens]|uniref:DUF1254 domain-containing protein n=1 Tax=Lutimonas zeaxanthinifaciens TaxID=3060215 RepID=UPI00265CA8DB|nr:DUF1254 domain-containing protein [Lutimonas sp. YSD2104]WKK67500.1 DUF1254 domain-containing protein [Lutimonas sp. YSD2104]
MKPRFYKFASLLLIGGLFACTMPDQKETTAETSEVEPIKKHIVTPSVVETERLGTLNYFDGYPSEETVEKVYDNLDFTRGMETFLNGIPAASMHALVEGFKSEGVNDLGEIAIFENLMDSRSIFLTPNTESVYTISHFDLKDGPIVVESPPNTLGMINDMFFRYVTDLGNAGPDKGQGGKYLVLPPDYDGDVPDGYFVVRPPTYQNIIFWRGFLQKGDPGPAVESIKANTNIYLLSQAKNPPEAVFIDWSGKRFNTVHANDFKFYEELNEVIQYEPSEAFEPQILGLFKSIGIEKGKEFNPDERMRAILEDAVKVGNATARSISFSPRNKDIYIYPDSYWTIAFLGGYQFMTNHARELDGRTLFHYIATAVTPAMEIKMVGVGSQYAATYKDDDGHYLDGSKNYKLTIPADPPVKDFWSIVIYDPQTRSMLETDNPFPSVNSELSDLEKNSDGSVDLYFGPKPPEGKEKNWIQTIENKGWFVLLRIYGPLEPWFDKTWQPGEIQLIKE